MISLEGLRTNLDDDLLLSCSIDIEMMRIKITVLISDMNFHCVFSQQLSNRYRFRQGSGAALCISSNLTKTLLKFLSLNITTGFKSTLSQSTF